MFSLLEEITHLISLMQLEVYSFYTTNRKMQAFCNIPISQEEKGKRKHMAPENLKPLLKVKKKKNNLLWPVSLEKFHIPQS